MQLSEPPPRELAAEVVDEALQYLPVALDRRNSALTLLEWWGANAFDLQAENERTLWRTGTRGARHRRHGVTALAALGECARAMAQEIEAQPYENTETLKAAGVPVATLSALLEMVASVSDHGGSSVTKVKADVYDKNQAAVRLAEIWWHLTGKRPTRVNKREVQHPNGIRDHGAFRAFCIPLLRGVFGKSVAVDAAIQHAVKNVGEPPTAFFNRLTGGA
jgi:hypothetical protein